MSIERFDATIAPPSTSDGRDSGRARKRIDGDNASKLRERRDHAVWIGWRPAGQAGAGAAAAIISQRQPPQAMQ